MPRTTPSPTTGHPSPVHSATGIARDALYDRDFVEWTIEQARLIKSGDFAALDLKNLAEEIEVMGGSQKSEIASRLAVILEHLLKWEYQPGKRKYGWRSSLSEQRGALYFALAASPSLKAQPSRVLERAYEIGRIRAASDTGLPERSFPRDCPYSVAQVLDGNFFPGPEEKDIV